MKTAGGARFNWHYLVAQTRRWSNAYVADCCNTHRSGCEKNGASYESAFGLARCEEWLGFRRRNKRKWPLRRGNREMIKPKIYIENVCVSHNFPNLLALHREEWICGDVATVDLSSLRYDFGVCPRNWTQLSIATCLNTFLSNLLESLSSCNSTWRDRWQEANNTRNMIPKHTHGKN